MLKVGKTRFPLHIRAIFAQLYPREFRCGAINALASGDIVATKSMVAKAALFTDKPATKVA